MLLAPTLESRGLFEGEFTVEAVAEKGTYVLTLHSK